MESNLYNKHLPLLANLHVILLVIIMQNSLLDCQTNPSFGNNYRLSLLGNLLLKLILGIVGVNLTKLRNYNRRILLTRLKTSLN
jgi:hypothetical protein